MSRQLSNLELSTQQSTTAEIASADASNSAFTAPPFSDKTRRHNSFPIFNQQKNSTWAPSLASISSGTVEMFLSRSLDPNLNGRKCLASALDRSQLAILTSFNTSFEIYLFDTNQSPVPGQQLEILGRHPLGRGTWTGVTIAGSYLAAWGEKVLHLAVRSDSPDAIKYDVCFAGSIPTFNTNQKAALSRKGVLAATNGQEIELRFASRPNTPVTLRCPVKVTKSIDIAFNEEGDNLYYWARVLNAFLFSWQLKDDGNNPDPVSAIQYHCKQGEEIDEATLFPYSGQRGCIVGYSARTICFPGLVSGKHIEKPVKRKVSEELKKKQVQAARVLDDSSLIAIQGPSSGFNNDLAVYEYPLQGHGTSASIGNGKKLGKLSMKFRNKKEAILYNVSAFRDQGERTLHVVVCSPDAHVEVVTVKANG
ncbi:hypothetical protein N431DRAFT_69167 [Stipitochalara longipes BDJ]|nr:hypothetical protein N431DRAFT_69167 [Stipitochalara longipes BDJ]